MRLLKKDKTTRTGELVSLVDEKFDEGTDWTILRQVMINRAFYEGRQWISWDDSQKRLYEPPYRRGEVRYTYNKIKPTIMTLHAKLTKNKVKMEVMPDTNDTDRIEAAKGGQKFLQWQWKEDDMDGKSSKLKLLMLIDGFAALKVYPDRKQGYDITPEPTEDDPNPEPVKSGKICTKVCDIFSLRIDPAAEFEDEIRWVIERRPRDVKEIEDEYGVKVAPEDNIEIRPNYLISTNEAKKYTNMAWVYEYWELPCPEYPKGRKITTAGGELLDYSEDPGEFPFVFFPMIPIPGRVIGAGYVQDLTTPQRSYNVKRTAEARILEEMGNPMWMVPEAAGVDDDEIVNEIGAIVHYETEAGGKPERVRGVEPGNGWQNAMERDESDMEDISGAHEISQGGVPKGVDTYGGLQLLVEQDETKLAIAAHSYERGIKKWGEKVLRLVKEYFPEEQELKIVGENRRIEIIKFAGADLTGGEDVDVIQGSSMPESRAVKEAKILRMWEAGIFTDPKTGQPDTRRVARLLGEHIADAYYDDQGLDESNAKLENFKWEQQLSGEEAEKAFMSWQEEMMQFQQQADSLQQQGIPIEQTSLKPPEFPFELPEVREFEDHEIHLQCHNRFRKGEAYRKLPDWAQKIVDQHCQEHEQYITDMIERQKQVAKAEQQAELEKEMQLNEQEHRHEMEQTQLEGQIDIQKKQIEERSDLIDPNE